MLNIKHVAMEYRGDQSVYRVLNELSIHFDYYEHPPAPTIEDAAKYWVDLDAAHCKNIFMRNHKGNRHYLIVFHYLKNLRIRDLELRLRQGKLTFASPKRLSKYLGLEPGSVSPFGLIHDRENHTHLFLDTNLQQASHISFHPNLNTASLVIAFTDFVKYLNWVGNSYEFVELYDQ